MYAALEYERLQYGSQSLEKKVQVILKGPCLKNSYVSHLIVKNIDSVIP
jgi:hypothetical protein